MENKIYYEPFITISDETFKKLTMIFIFMFIIMFYIAYVLYYDLNSYKESNRRMDRHYREMTWYIDDLEWKYEREKVITEGKWENRPCDKHYFIRE